MLWRVYRLTGQSYGVALYVINTVGAFFGNSFESPMEAIPFYLLMGLVIGPVLCRRIIVMPAAEFLLPTQSRTRSHELLPVETR